MPITRKPNPKSQQQISNDQVDPYVFPESGESLGNPNIPSEFNQFTPNNQSGIDFNRSNQMSFKDDTTKQFTVGLQDIDESIMFYFQNVIRPFVYHNGVRLYVIFTVFTFTNFGFCMHSWSCYFRFFYLSC